MKRGEDIRAPRQRPLSPLKTPPKKLRESSIDKGNLLNEKPK
jgi:hypothetical protein